MKVQLPMKILADEETMSQDNFGPRMMQSNTTIEINEDDSENSDNYESRIKNGKLWLKYFKGVSPGVIMEKFCSSKFERELYKENYPVELSALLCYNVCDKKYGTKKDQSELHTMHSKIKHQSKG